MRQKIAGPGTPGRHARRTTWAYAFRAIALLRRGSRPTAPARGATT